MRAWPADHPKAKLMDRKRADILLAAKAAFLETGYGGTSMEGIAKRANVSIMTLYRHAQSKDVLFGAVIASACAPADDGERAGLEAIFGLPLEHALLESALHLQELVSADDTVALLRVVLADVTRFPELGELAYAGLIGHLETMAAWLLSEVAPASRLPDETRRRLARVFVDRIVGADLLRVLLGLPGSTADERRRRAQQARDDVMREIAAGDQGDTTAPHR
jgi:TetR/AcrR family transcriptional repressor of mexJK operon